MSDSFNIFFQIVSPWVFLNIYIWLSYCTKNNSAEVTSTNWFCSPTFVYRLRVGTPSLNVIWYFPRLLSPDNTVPEVTGSITLVTNLESKLKLSILVDKSLICSPKVSILLINVNPLTSLL
jgi:hypothetical protein